MPSLALVRYVLKAALRDRLFIALVLSVLCAAALSVFIGSSAVVEQSKFSLVFAASGIRFICVAGLSLFVVFYVRRAYDTREVEFLLARPLTRTSFITSHALAFILLAIVIAAPAFAGIMTVSGKSPGAGIILWAVSLAVELAIVANIAFFFSMALSSAVGSALATFGFYALARLMGGLLGTMKSGIASNIPGVQILQYIMDFITLFIPRLDLMAQSSWLVYGSDGIGFGFVIVQGVVFTALVLLASLLDFNRRQF